MTDLEALMRSGFAQVPEPDLRPHSELGRDLWRRRTRQRAAVPVGAAAVAVAAASVIASREGHTRPQVFLESIPSTSAGPMPSASPEIVTRARVVQLADLTFEVPGDLRDLRPASVSHSKGVQTSSVYSVAFGEPNIRALDITLYDGALAAGEWSAQPPGSPRHIAVVGHLAKVINFEGFAPAGHQPYSTTQLFVRVSADRTLLLTSSGLDEATLIGIAAKALE